MRTAARASTTPSTIVAPGDPRPGRPAGDGDRAVADAVLRPHRVEEGGQLIDGRGVDGPVQVEDRLLLPEPHDLLEAGRAGPAHRQAGVEPPGVETLQGQRRGERLLRARRVHEVPGEHQGRVGARGVRRAQDEGHAGGGSGDGARGEGHGVLLMVS